MKNYNLKDFDLKVEGSPIENFSRLDNLYLGSKVSSKEDIAYLKSLGVDAVYDLKNDNETNFDDRREFESAGIEYHQLAISNLSDLSIEQIKEFSNNLEKTDKNKLIYCMSGNRVSALLGLKFSLLNGVSVEEVTELFTKLGLTKEALRDKMIEVINTHQKGN